MKYKKLKEKICSVYKDGEDRLSETADYIGVTPEVLRKKLEGSLPIFAHEACLISDFLGTEKLADKLSFFYPDVPKVGQKGGEKNYGKQSG